MPATTFDASRVSKIAQIMPEFGSVAEPGDVVMMGLEGDPLFPNSYHTNRPTCRIENIQKLGDEYRVKLVNVATNEASFVNTSSLSPNDVWEFTDASFDKVVERQRLSKQKARAEDASYRGQHEINELRAELRTEREVNKAFQATVIDSFKEFARDMCKLDQNKACEFCHLFSSQYDTMKARNEPGFRGLVEKEAPVQELATRKEPVETAPVTMTSRDDDSMSDDSDFF